MHGQTYIKFRCIDVWYHRSSSPVLREAKSTGTTFCTANGCICLQNLVAYSWKFIGKLRAWPYVMSGRMRSLHFYLRQGDASE